MQATRISFATACGISLLTATSADAQERTLVGLSEGASAIIWKDAAAQTEGAALIDSGAAKRNPSLVAPLIACLVSPGTKAVVTGSPGWFIRSVTVTDGASAGCRGVVYMENLQ